MTPCARCVTPAKCGIHGCCPGTWPAEKPSGQHSSQANCKAAQAKLDAMRKDAERYRKLRRGQHLSSVNGVGDVLCAEQLDAAIDALP